MNKIERLSAILVKLQSRRYVTAQEIADQFRISIRTVYRDLRLLEESGVPIVSTPYAGYSLIDGYRLPPLMFNTDEAIAFLMAEKLLGAQSDPDSYRLFRSGMDKIRSALKSAEKNILEDFEENIVALSNSFQTPEGGGNEILGPLLRCILDKRQVRIEYHANYNRETTQRETEPLGIFFLGAEWYVMAWCNLRGDYRTFKLSRIVNIEPTDNPFHRVHPSLKEVLLKVYPVDVSFDITLRVKKEALRNMGRAKHFYGFRNEVDDGEYVIQHYTTYSPEHFGRWFLSFADKARIIDPPELKDLVRDLIKGIEI